MLSEYKFNYVVRFLSLSLYVLQDNKLRSKSIKDDTCR